MPPKSPYLSSLPQPTRKNRALVWTLRASLPIGIGFIGLLVTPPASAVPSFTDQTGQPCQACHVGGFGPQLTPFGREFKLGGYTMRAKAGIPVSAMAVASFNHTRADQNPPPDGFDGNDNLAFDQASLFVAGGIGHHLDGFVQMTYDGVARQWHWDNLDLRAVTTGQVFGQDVVFGLTLNNAPTVQDVWNTTPAWGFPYSGGAIAAKPGASPLIGSAFAQSTLGISAYSWIGQKLYLEAGAYSSPAAGTLSWLGVDPSGTIGDISGLAPYGRVAWQGQLSGGTVELGAFALKAAINPGRDRTSGFTDHYADVGLDASWQKALASGNTVTAQLRYTHEASNLQASCALALIGDGSTSDCAHTTLNDWRGDLSYSWHNKVASPWRAFPLPAPATPTSMTPPPSILSPASPTAMASWARWIIRLGVRAIRRWGRCSTCASACNTPPMASSTVPGISIRTRVAMPPTTTR